MEKNYKKDIPFLLLLFYKPKSQENEALGPSQNCTLLLNYQIPNSKCSSQGMDEHVDSSKTLMGKVVWLVL